MTSYISTLYDALREGAAQGAQPLCEIIPVLAKMYFTALHARTPSGLEGFHESACVCARHRTGTTV